MNKIKMSREQYSNLIKDTIKAVPIHGLINEEVSLKNAIEKGYIELTEKENALRLINLRIENLEKNQSIAHKRKKRSIADWVIIRDSVEKIEEKIYWAVIEHEEVKCTYCNSVIKDSFAYGNLNINGNFCSLKCVDLMAERIKQ